MRKYGKWLLVLGILAANPAWASADGFLSGLRPTLPQSKAAQKQENEKRASQVMDALRQARVDGYDVTVEVRGDTAKVDGKVRNVNHRAVAERACRQVPGIKRILNNLKYVPSGNVQQTAARVSDSSLRPATYNVVDGAERGVQQVHFQKPGKRSKPTKRTPPKRVSNYQPRPQTTTQSARPTSQPWSNQRPASTVNVPSKPRPVVKKAAAPPAVPPIQVPPIEIQQQVVIPQPKLELPAPVEVSAPKAETTPLDLTTAMAPQDLKIPAQPAGPNNQQVAQNIAASLEEVGLVGYNIEVRYEDGTANLAGDVPSAQQIQAAGFAASRVPGVDTVTNNLKMSGPISQTGYNPGGYPMPSGYPTPMPGQQMHPVSMMAAPGMGGGGAPSPIGGAGNYSNPQLPSHAWPAYAQYPNSAAVSYPKQHSASAFPYIGPFYPYPQVPLGWREVSLQWDDGYWQLDFEQKKDAWYWLFAPKNWH